MSMSRAPGPRLLPVTTTSDEARRHFMAGRHHAFHYQDRQARECLDAALALDPHFVLAYLHRGGMSSPQDRGHFFEQARAHRDHVSEDEGRMVDAFHAFLWDGQVQDAVAIFADLADRYADDPYLPTYLGLRYLHNLGQLDAASEQFERARDRDPAFAQAALWLGQVAFQEGDLDRAQQELDTYVQLAPDQPRPYDCLGLLYLHRGQFDDAEGWFRQALERDPNFVESRQNLVRVEVERGNRALVDALHGGDLDEIAGRYTAGSTVTLPGSGRLSGPAEVVSAWSRILRDVVTVELDTVAVLLGADADLATETADYRLSSGDGSVDAGTALTVWARTVRGWKIHRSVWASDAAL